MTSTTAGSGGSSTGTGAQAATGQFMLTLCRLPGPMSIRPPQSPQLKSFTFFTTRERGPDGSEHSYLHMGYFRTLADAEKWAEGVRGRFPDAIATITAGAFVRPGSLPSTEDKSLSDTQVMRILETRGVAQDAVDQNESDRVALLRPEDTSTRQALKEAVAQGAPVSFAVQLQWSAQPIDLGRVPSLPIFKAHTLYATENRRDGRSRYFLRMGFFADPIDAKQAAAEVRSNFAAAAVVPVSDQEVTRAREAGKDSSSIPTLVQQESNRAPEAGSALQAATQAQAAVGLRRRVAGDDEKLQLELKKLARREMWTNPDLLSDSGVRHLKVRIEAQKRTPNRSKGAGA
jgi:hypothetical protein